MFSYIIKDISLEFENRSELKNLVWLYSSFDGY